MNTTCLSHIKIVALLVSLACTSMPGCAGVSEEVRKAAQENSTHFLIGAEDILEVHVWRNPDLTRDVVVRPDGMISMPLIGDVPASGLTADAVAGEITTRLTEFMDSPQVTVHVKQVNSYVLFVVGEVNAPGKYQLKSYVSVLQAIALAGGFTQYASRNDIQVVRNGSNGHGTAGELHIPVRYDDLVKGEGELGNFLLRSGDTLVVP